MTVTSSCWNFVEDLWSSKVQGAGDQVGKILIHQLKQARDAAVAPEQARWLGAMINADWSKILS